ncbi:MAG: hypothetical protein H6728_12210 [Myxococcales bacterium]|nr:hypothetical protein [Myxococcales bacterium]MCB9643829.1 hypothetical protein [Myxococcales bacterium]
MSVRRSDNNNAAQRTQQAQNASRSTQTSRSTSTSTPARTSGNTFESGNRPSFSRPSFNRPQITTQSNTQFVNGRPSSSSSTATLNGRNLQGSAQLDTQFGRNGQITQQDFSANLTRNYGATTINRQAESHYTNQTTNTSGAMNRGFDYQNRAEASTNTTVTHDFRADQRGTPEQEAARAESRQNRADMMNRAQNIGNFAANNLGLRSTAEGSIGGQTQAALIDNGQTFVGARAQATAEGSASIGADGLHAQGNAEARAGLYAETQGQITGDYGTLAGSAGARAEVYAQAEGSASLDLNGLNVQGGARIGAEVSADVHGSYTTPPVTIGGVDMTAGVDANARVAAQAEASATGRVQITGNPPTAIIEGEVGASAVVKAEADATIHAGPFSVTGSAYASAGAEARAHGSIGFDDGKLTISGGLGAALGIGAGADVAITVDVGAIGDAAVGLARQAGEAVVDGLDANNNGRLDIGDAVAIGENAIGAVRDGAQAVGNAIGDGVEAVGNAVSNGARAVGNAISDAGNAVGNAISDAGNAIKNVFSGW